MSVALLVMTDGRRDLIESSIISLEERIKGPITRKVIHDDSGDRNYLAWLSKNFQPMGYEILFETERRGFSGAYNHAWKFLSEDVQEDYIFSTEDDFLYNREIDLWDMINVLDSQPYLIQLVLKRQPWNEEEKAAGGIVECSPDDYADRYMKSIHGPFIIDWLEHRRFFSTNPSLFRRELCSLGWPNVQYSEGTLTHQLLREPKSRFAFWGKRTDHPWVEHIGYERTGSGY